MGPHKHVNRFAVLLAFFGMVLGTLTSCAGVPVREESSVALPTARVAYVAPIGDAALEYTAPATLYLPRHDGDRLSSLTETIPFSAARLEAESIVRALLLYPGDGVTSALGGDVKLALYGANPVEVSGDVATVNLAASALQLDRQQLYVCGQAIANTLTELAGIRYVNLLVMDKHIGLDLGSTLPTGALTRSVVADIAAAYEQALAQRVQADEDPSQKHLTATASLYFPLKALNGVLSEARNISFTSQEPSAIVLRLMEELSEGPLTTEGSPPLPLLAQMLTEPPTVTETASGGGRLITLRFDTTLYDMLAAMEMPRASCFASIGYTLSTFMPNIAGITLYVGEERIDHVMLDATTGLLFADGVQKRADYAPLLMDRCVLYLPEQAGERLVMVERPVPFYQRTSPRALLLALFYGPSPMDAESGTAPVFPTGTLTDADILGISLSEQTLIVNLSGTFGKLGAGMTVARERLLAYAMVNTLLCGEEAKRVCFFVNGNKPTGFTGELYWPGIFYPNTGLAYEPD